MKTNYTVFYGKDKVLNSYLRTTTYQEALEYKKELEQDGMKVEIIKDEYSKDEFITIGKNMHLFGGSFFKTIGAALQRADWENSIKLSEAFPDEFCKYLNW